MSNRLYKIIVVAQISLIALLLLFMLNAEGLLERIRATTSTGSSLSQDHNWHVVTFANENRNL